MRNPLMSYSPEALMELAREHWKEFLPIKYATYLKDGTLDSNLRAAANLTLQAMADDRSAGYSQAESWDMESRYYILPKPEPTPPSSRTRKPATS
jgi:hypothetical protein